MRHNLVFAVAIILMLLGGCCLPANRVPRRVEQVVLLNVQGFSGGRDVWITADGIAICRVVTRPENGQTGLQEVRYTFAVPADYLQKIQELVKKHHFCSLHTTDRYGIPDEARPAIYIQIGTQICSAAKWHHDTHADFDAMYSYLLMLSEYSSHGAQVGAGAYDWAWKPSGFPENIRIYELTRPNLEDD